MGNKEETEASDRIFVTSIKTTEKKQKLFGIDCLLSFDVERSMFNVRCSSFNISLYRNDMPR